MAEIQPGYWNPKFWANGYWNPGYWPGVPTESGTDRRTRRTRLPRWKSIAVVTIEREAPILARVRKFYEARDLRDEQNRLALEEERIRREAIAAAMVPLEQEVGRVMESLTRKGRAMRNLALVGVLPEPKPRRGLKWKREARDMEKRRQMQDQASIKVEMERKKELDRLQKRGRALANLALARLALQKKKVKLKRRKKK